MNLCNFIEEPMTLLLPDKISPFSKHQGEQMVENHRQALGCEAELGTDVNPPRRAG